MSANAAAITKIEYFKFFGIICAGDALWKNYFTIELALVINKLFII